MKHGKHLSMFLIDWFPSIEKEESSLVAYVPHSCLNLLYFQDAAHIHSPAGGQGMNTGLQDAYNLAWKLALVLKGSSPASLLETYDPERRTIANEVVTSTDRLTQVISLKTEWGQKVRNKMMAYFSGFDVRSLIILFLFSNFFQLVQHKFVENLSQVHVTYSGSHSNIVVDTSVGLLGTSQAKVPPGLYNSDSYYGDC
jgi:hypothetical protein